jgi:hypothetical protein
LICGGTGLRLQDERFHLVEAKQVGVADQVIAMLVVVAVR